MGVPWFGFRRMAARNLVRYAARLELAGGAKTSLTFAKVLDRSGPIGRGCP